LRGRGRREVGARGDPPTRQRDHLLRERRASLGPRLPRQHPRAGHPRGPERRVEAEDSLREHPAALRAAADGATQLHPLSKSRHPPRVAQYSQARNIERSSGRIEAWASISPRESGLTSPSRSASLSTRALSGRETAIPRAPGSDPPAAAEGGPAAAAARAAAGAPRRGGA